MELAEVFLVWMEISWIHTGLEGQGLLRGLKLHCNLGAFFSKYLHLCDAQLLKLMNKLAFPSIYGSAERICFLLFAVSWETKLRKKWKWSGTRGFSPSDQSHCQTPFLLIYSPRRIFHIQLGNGNCGFKLSSQVQKWTMVHVSWQWALPLTYMAAKSCGVCLRNKCTTQGESSSLSLVLLFSYTDLDRVSSKHCFSALTLQ